MNITEEQKQEADRIVEKYNKLTTYQYQEYAGAHPSTFEHDKDTLFTLAIQDRQSVLEDNKSVFEMLKLHGDIRICLPIHKRIQSLTNQIEYLKTKI